MDVILTAYFNSKPDVQRGITWDADVENIRTLVESCKDHEVVVLTDCLKQKPKEWKHVKFINVKIKYNPYFARWFGYRDYLMNQPSIKRVFMVDATDVEMLNSPFDKIQDFIYVGDEKDVLGTKWMVENHAELGEWFKGSDKPLLNCGIVGGPTDLIIPLLFDMKMLYMILGEHAGVSDMALLNFILYTKWSGLFKHGGNINTHFNKFERDETKWFMHK